MVESSINHFFFIIILILLFFINLIADFLKKKLKCRLFNKNSRKSPKNVLEQSNVTETINLKDY